MNSAPANSFSRPLALVFLLMIAGAAAFWLRPTANPNVSHRAQLFLNTPELAPTTTFEVRFDETMTGPESIGLEAMPSPLEIQPPLAGKFVWLSRRSGVFTPSEPTALNSTYTVGLRAGLLTVDGTPSKATLRQRFTTPPFGFTHERNYYQQHSTNAGSLPFFQLYFNADVATNAVRSHLRFVNAAGRSIPAEVSFGSKWLRTLRSGYDDGNQTWVDRFPTPDAKPSAPISYLGRDQEDKYVPAPNRLTVRPVHPLPAGDGWKLVVERGLPAADGRLRTLQTEELPIGDVQPLRVTEIIAHNNLNAPRELRIWFNKQLSPELLGTNALDWFRIDPPVENLEFRIARWGGRNVSLAGNFQLWTNYNITVRSGFPAPDEFLLEQAVSNNVTFEPLAPQVMLPAFSGDQLAGGRREFEFLSLNCNEVGLTVKRLQPEHLIHALRGYRAYLRSPFSRPPGHALDYELVPGITSFQTKIHPEPKVDAVIRHAFKWDTLFGGKHFGAALVQVVQGNAEAHTSNATVAQAVVQLTDLGLVWKKSKAELLAWCFSYATGEPVAGATIKLASDENEVFATQVTDNSGLVRFVPDANGTWLVAEKGGDVHAAELSEGNLSTYGSGIPYEYWQRSADSDTGLLRGMMFTERKVYRPGDNVFVKGIVRELRDGHPEFPDVRQLRLTCVDSEDTEVFATNLNLSALGSVDAALPLPIAPMGTYRIHLTATNGAGEFETSITMAEYEPNAFELKVAAKPAYAAGEPVEIPVSAGYYMGKSLSNARLRWMAETEDETFAPSGFGEFTFNAYGYLYREHNPSGAAMTLQGELVLGTDGKTTLAPAVALNTRFPQPRGVNLHTEVTDANQQTVTEEATFVRHSSDFYLGARQTALINETGHPMPVEVIAVNADGSPRAESVPVRLTLKKIEYRTVRLEGAGKSVAFRNEREDRVIFETNITALALTNLGTKWEVAADAQPAMIQASEAGEHLIELRAQDSSGHEVLTALGFYATSKEEASWSYRSDVRLKLVPGQTNYHAGDTARLLVKTPVSGTALVTVERERVLRHFNVELQGNAPTIEIPLTDADAPNVYISVLMLRGADKTPRQSKLPEYRYGYCVLNVESRATRLDVAVQAAKSDYLPGQTVNLAVQVIDGFDTPATDAEVTLYAVDEGVLSLTGYPRPDPHAFFYDTRPLGVNTGVSIDRLEPENPELAHFENKGFIIGGGGRTDTRKNFVACAFWNATLRTDGAGRVTAQFKAPDNLTRFRVIAVAHTAKQQFGSGESGFNINKPLMLEPSLPRFANTGDEIILRALVHNQSPRAGEVQVELALDKHAVALFSSDGEKAGERGNSANPPLTPPRRGTNNPAPLPSLEGLGVGSEASRMVFLAPGASAYVEFPVRFTEAGLAKWTWRAKFADPAIGGFTDAVESKLNVGHPQPLLRETYLARSDAGPLDLLAGVNPQLLEGRGTIHVRVATTRLVELSEGIQHLLHYPYGCAEQTSSSLLPWVLLNDFPDVLSVGKTGGLNRDRALQMGFNRLAQMQTSSGGLAYWPGGKEPMLWASTYGGFVLALADARGHRVPRATLDKLLNYLATSLKGLENIRDDHALNERCLALLALAMAGKPEPSYHEVMFRKRDVLSGESRALLALAVMKGGGPETMAAELLDAKVAANGAADSWFGCRERESAIRLAALAALRPKDAELDRVAAELMHRQHAGRWVTTQGNAWALFALTEYARQVEQPATEAHAGVSFNGAAHLVTLTATQRVADLEFVLQPGALPQLHLDNTTGRRLFTTVTIESRATTADLPRQDRGFSVARRYDLLANDGTLRPFKNARVGDTVVVTLDLEVHQSSRFVALDDALPAVFEEVNPAFKSQRTRADARAQDWFSDFQQIQGDRVQFFRDYLPAGRYSITHLARVRASGAVTAPGTKVEAMYHPEQFGFSGTSRVSTQPAE